MRCLARTLLAVRRKKAGSCGQEFQRHASRSGGICHVLYRRHDAPALETLPRPRRSPTCTLLPARSMLLATRIMCVMKSMPMTATRQLVPSRAFACKTARKTAPTPERHTGERGLVVRVMPRGSRPLPWPAGPPRQTLRQQTCAHRQIRAGSHTPQTLPLRGAFLRGRLQTWQLGATLLCAREQGGQSPQSCLRCPQTAQSPRVHLRDSERQLPSRWKTPRCR